MAPSARISPNVFVCVCAHVFPYSIFLNPLLKQMHPMENLFGDSTANFGHLSRRKPDSPYLNHCGFINFRHEGHLEPRSLLGSPSFIYPGENLTHPILITAVLSIFDTKVTWSLAPFLGAPHSCSHILTQAPSPPTHTHTHTLPHPQLHALYIYGKPCQRIHKWLVLKVLKNFMIRSYRQAWPILYI